MKSQFKRGIVILSLLVLASCSNRADTEPKAVIKEKAEARWTARIKGEDEKLYAYLSPSLKALTAEDVYKSKAGSAVSYHDAMIKHVKCDSEKPQEMKSCEVVIDVTYSVSGLRGAGTFKNTRPLKEKWIKEDGDWWIYDK